MEQLLRKSLFAKVNRGCLVDLEHVEEFDTDDITVAGMKIPFNENPASFVCMQFYIQ